MSDKALALSEDGLRVRHRTRYWSADLSSSFATDPRVRVSVLLHESMITGIKLTLSACCTKD